MTTGEPIWNGHSHDKWIQYKAYLTTIDTTITPKLRSVNVSFKYVPKLMFPKLTPANGDVSTKFNFSIEYHNKNNETPIFISISIDGENHSMFESEKNDLNLGDGKTYWFSLKFSAGEHSYKFYASDGEVDCISDLFTFYVEFGPLDHIIIQPSSSKITTDDYLIFSAEGYDEDNNSLPIYPTWSVNSGGLIDQDGNFTANTPGIWTVYSNYSGITGKTTINVTLGELDRIIISPQLGLITTDDFLLFNATGYDRDNNILQIIVKWEITGGGTINQIGNFTPTTPGEWLVYANTSEISGVATIFVEEGKLNRITIFPNSTKINLSESITFTAKGYDVDSNVLYIYPNWEISGGGSINKNGVFTGTKPGIWFVYANKSDITSIATVEVIKIEDKGKTDKDQAKEKKDNPFFYIGIGIIIIIIVILMLYLFIFKKKIKKDKKPPEKPLQPTDQISQNLQSEQSLTYSQSQNHQIQNQTKST